MFFTDTDNQFHLLSVIEYNNIESQHTKIKCMDFDILSFRLKGCAEYKLEEKVFSLKTNDLIFIPRNTHYTLSADDENLIVFHFITTGPHPLFPECYTPRNPATFKVAFQSAAKTWSAHKPGYYQKTTAFFYNVLAEMNLQFDPAYNNASYLRIKDALDYLHLNYRDSSLCVNQLCQICNLSDTQFRKCFHDVYGTTPLNYINQLRTDYAADLLANTDFSMKYIAEESGFTDDKYFSYVFKKYHNKTPSAQRQLK